MGALRDELVFCKEHGAVGVMMRGTECELPLSDPYFFPLYELATELDLAAIPALDLVRILAGSIQVSVPRPPKARRAFG